MVVVVAAVAAADSAAAAVVATAVIAVAIGAVVAENGNAELVSAAVVETSASTSTAGESHPANSNAPRARGTQSDVTEARPEPRPAVQVPSELVSLANEIGVAWSQTYVRMLQEQDRDIVGAWPGTIREARRQVLARIKLKLEPEQLDQLARMTNLAARRGWETVSEPDLES